MEPILHHGKLKGLGVTVEGSRLAPFFIYSVVACPVWITRVSQNSLRPRPLLQKCKMRGFKSVKWILTLCWVSKNSLRPDQNLQSCKLNTRI